jgi:hypothetical protein
MKNPETRLIIQAAFENMRQDKNDCNTFNKVANGIVLLVGLSALPMEIAIRVIKGLKAIHDPNCEVSHYNDPSKP